MKVGKNINVTQYIKVKENEPIKEDKFSRNKNDNFIIEFQSQKYEVQEKLNENEPKRIVQINIPLPKIVVLDKNEMEEKYCHEDAMCQIDIIDGKLLESKYSLKAVLEKLMTFKEKVEVAGECSRINWIECYINKPLIQKGNSS